MTQSIEIVERHKEIDREYEDCITDSGYEHQFKGVAFELNDVVSAFSKGTITEAISVLVGYYFVGNVGALLASLAGIVASAIVDLYTGDEFTMGMKDGYIDWEAGYSPQINGVVASSYDSSAPSTTDVASVPDVHIGGQHEISSELAHDNPWQK